MNDAQRKAAALDILFQDGGKKAKGGFPLIPVVIWGSVIFTAVTGWRIYCDSGAPTALSDVKSYTPEQRDAVSDFVAVCITKGRYLPRICPVAIRMMASLYPDPNASPVPKMMGENFDSPDPVDTVPPPKELPRNPKAPMNLAEQNWKVPPKEAAEKPVGLIQHTLDKIDMQWRRHTAAAAPSQDMNGVPPL